MPALGAILSTTSVLPGMTDYGSFSSALVQGVVGATVAYPLIFESQDSISGLYQQNKTFTVDNSGVANCTITCPTAHLLTAGAPVVLNPLVDGTGLTQGTVYFVSATNLTANTFELSSTFGGASDMKTTATGSGTVTCVSRVYIRVAGRYLFILSSVLNTTDNSAATMDVWFVKGNKTTDTAGTNVTKSNTQTAIDTNGTQTVCAVPMILNLAVDDFIRLDYRGSTSKVQWLAGAAGANPTRPAMPSVILTVSRIGD